jgi:hypothetical protein
MKLSRSNSFVKNENASVFFLVNSEPHRDTDPVSTHKIITQLKRVSRIPVTIFSEIDTAPQNWHCRYSKGKLQN